VVGAQTCDDHVVTEPLPVLRRPDAGRVVAGVCAGLSEHLLVGVGTVRVAFVLLSLLGGFGALLYAGLWLAVPAGTPEPSRAPGLDAAARHGRRPAGPDVDTAAVVRSDPGLLVALALLGVGAVMLVDRAVAAPAGAFWPLAVVAVGAAVVWRQAEAREASRAAVTARVVAGVAVVALGLALFLAGQGELGVLLDALAAVLVVLAGIAVVTGPWLLRLVRDLQAERAERVRSQERADLAAHLHDSVLQTLAVIQRQAHDPDEVNRLARAQERDLRRWLYGEESPAPTGVRTALEAVAAEVEDAYATPVEVVVVGDAPWAAGGVADAVVAATREALTNAAKHSGAGRIDLFAEVSGEQVEVFVRDRGTGFDPARVAADRQGVKGSIVERMERNGGRATVTSAPGDGTEVHLVGPLGRP
jgi:signal transduction histidine kinase/phage shock protein PspC (stress-responsive transcriptional regulator)